MSKTGLRSGLSLNVSVVRCEKWMVGEGNDAEVLAAVLAVEPDYFVTGDGDFHAEEVSRRMEVVETTEALEEIGYSGSA